MKHRVAIPEAYVIMTEMENKNVYVIAGPNGSGKTTFAREFLPAYAKCQNFINADLIAQGLSPFSPRNAAIKAGKLVLGQIHEYAGLGMDFAFESTLAGKSHVRLFSVLKAKGYRIHLFFLWIPGPELAIARIKGRVMEGGHDIPAQDVRRRFTRSTQNLFDIYQILVDSWMIFNNAREKPELVAKAENGKAHAMNKELYKQIRTLKGHT